MDAPHVVVFIVLFIFVIGFGTTNIFITVIGESYNAAVAKYNDDTGQELNAASAAAVSPANEQVSEDADSNDDSCSVNAKRAFFARFQKYSDSIQDPDTDTKGIHFNNGDIAKMIIILNNRLIRKSILEKV